MKEIKHNKWKGTPCPQIPRINLAKTLIPPRAIYRIDAIFIKIVMVIFYKSKEKHSKIYVETQMTEQSKKKKKSWGIKE